MQVSIHQVGLKLYLGKNEINNLNDQYSVVEDICSRCLMNQADENSKAQLQALTSNPVKMKTILAKLGFQTQEIRKLVREVFFDGKTSWNHGDALSREEAEAKLAKAPLGTWLVRFSKGQYVITGKKGEGEYVHIVRNGKNLDEVLDNIFDKYSELDLLITEDVIEESSYHHGDIGNDQTIQLLKDLPLGYGLLRYSSNRKKHYLSVKISEIKFDHFPLPQNTSEKPLFTLKQMMEVLVKSKELSGLNLTLFAKSHLVSHLVMVRGVQIEREIQANKAALNSYSTLEGFDVLEKITKELPPTNLASHRYEDVLCPGLTSIRFGQEILHANFVQLGDMDYICAQAPLENDLAMFWRAAYLCSDLILDLTNHNEFYPEKLEETKIFGPVSVKCVKVESIEDRPDVVLFTYSLAGPNGTKMMKRLNYKGWPDQGVVNCKELMNIISWFGACRGDQRPIVHCKAGVGRTGVFCVANTLFEMLKSKKIDPERCLEALQEMILLGRYQRGSQFVQTPGQYALLVEFAKKEFS